MAEHASEKTLSPIQGAHIPSTETASAGGRREHPRNLTPTPKEEAMLAHVAVTRARQVLGDHGLAWVHDLERRCAGETRAGRPAAAKGGLARGSTRLVDASIEL